MNKEEKKAVEDMDKFANGIDMSGVSASQMQTILNLIEKLQKENEELNKLHIQDNKHLDFIMKHSIPIQKIKDKIKILEKLQNEFLNNEELRVKIIAYKELIEERSDIYENM